MHLPSLLAAVLAFVLSLGLFICGLIADGINTNQRLLEEVLFHLRRVEHDLAPATRRQVEALAELGDASAGHGSSSR